MGCVMKVVDAVLFLFFVLKAIGGPMFDAQICIPQQYQPNFLVDISYRYVSELGDYLVVDKPNFLVGLAWMELFVSSPLSIINIYGIISNKSWFKTTCLIHGVLLTTSMVAIISELVGSGKASETLLQVYYVFMGLSMLVIFKGLISFNCVADKSPLAAKKTKRN